MTRRMTSILRLPQIPEALREAAARTALVPFVGAGASKLAGCPSWSEFADDVLQCLVDEKCLSYSQIEQIRHLSPRTKLSIARMIERQTKSEIDFRALLHKTELDRNPDGTRLYDAVLKLGNVIVTTNYDCWLDQGARPSDAHETPSSAAGPIEVRRTVVSKPEEFLPSLLRGNAVIHLHGSVDHPRNMILTTRDYMSHYRNDRRFNNAQENDVLTFLQQLFQHKTVLFIGYGLEELEVLEYVLLKARPGEVVTTSAPKHFLLEGFFSHQDELVERLSGYYRESGIQLIPFLRDDMNWRQLIEVIENFASQIPAGQPLLLEQFQDMDLLLND
jgi:hypothetical protein